MSEANPYASPVSQVNLASVAPPVATDGLFREGNILVAPKTANFPDRCVKCNQPANGYRLKRTLYWHHPLIYLTALFNLLVYIVVAMTVRKTATFNVGVCQACKSRRIKAIAIAWFLFIGGMALGFFGASLSDQQSWGLGVAMLGFFSAIGGAIYGLVVGRVIAATNIDKEVARLKGIHPEFLAALPDWPRRS